MGPALSEQDRDMGMKRSMVAKSYGDVGRLGG